MDRVQVVAAEFSVKFDGPALDEHIMDVNVLAPALLALGRSLQAAHRVTEPFEPEPTLQIRATSEGSFDVNLMVTVLSSETVTAIANSAGVLGVNVWNLVKESMRVLKWRGGRRGVSIDDNRDGTITYRDADGNQINAPSGTQLLVENNEFRAAINVFTEPLESPGIDSVTIADRGAALDTDVSLNTLDRQALRFEPTEELLSDEEVPATLSVETAQLSGASKWWFSASDGAGFAAAVSDQRFLNWVAEGGTIGANDKLHVRLREIATKIPGKGIRVDRSVVEVVDIRRGPRQLRFDDIGPDYGQ